MRRAQNEEREATDRLGREAAGDGGELAAAMVPQRRPKRRASAAGLVEGARQLWAAPTRRHFLGLVLAAGAIAVGGEALRTPAAPRHTWNGRTRWIGHC